MLSHCSIVKVGAGSQPAFDWYRATLEVEQIAFLEAAKLAFDDVPGLRSEFLPAVRFFGTGIGLLDAHDVRVCAIYVAPDRPGTCNVIASGFYTDRMVSLVRRYPHACSRVDVCTDLLGEGLFGDLLAFTAKLAASSGLSRTIIAPDDPDKGSTIYLGSRTSQVFMRIYQVGLLRAKTDGREGDAITGPERLAVRVELEVKPARGPDRVKASQMAPSAFWGWSPWPRKVLAYVSTLDVERVKLSKRMESDRDRALRHMVSQYGRHLESLMSECHGDLEEFGSQIWKRFSA